MIPDPKESQIPINAADESAIESFRYALLLALVDTASTPLTSPTHSDRIIFEHGPQIQKDHHLVWFAHYELGRLHQMMGRHAQAQTEFEQVLSGKGMELSTKRGKGKVSLQVSSAAWFSQLFRLLTSVMLVGSRTWRC